MIIRNAKKSKVSKTNQKVLDTDLFSLYKKDDETLLKTYKINTSDYQKLLLFHKDVGYRAFLIELAQNFSNQDVINIPLELVNYHAFVYEMIINNLPGYMYLGNLAPKTNLDNFIASLQEFIERIKSLEGLDLTHIRINDIIYNGNFQILNPEFILLDKVNMKDNVRILNEIVLKSLYDVKKIINVDTRIQECLEYTLCGEIGVDVLLSEIKKIEEKENGKTKYIRHINRGYIK